MDMKNQKVKMDEVLKSINFADDYELMINDVYRNLYYKKILSAQNFEGKHLLEIGFGTGLLTFIALDLNASKVTAYEQKPHVYKISQEIIKAHSFKDKIELINERYYSKKTKHDYLIHELLAENIWGEYLFYCIKDLYHKIIPSDYFVNLYFKVMTRNSNIEEKPLDDYIFSPGIEINEEYVTLINKHIKKNKINSNQTESRIRDLSKKESGLNQKSSYYIKTNEKEIITQQHSSKTTQNITKLPDSITLLVYEATKDCQIILNLEMGISHAGYDFILTNDYPTKSWDQFKPEDLNKKIDLKKGEKLYFTQLLYNGDFHFKVL